MPFKTYMVKYKEVQAAGSAIYTEKSVTAESEYDAIEKIKSQYPAKNIQIVSVKSR